MTTTRTGIYLTREQLEAWAGQPLTDDELAQLDEAIPHSSIPEAVNTITGTFAHRARPDDDPEPGDRCKDCGGPITWTGPSMNDWDHIEQED